MVGIRCSIPALGPRGHLLPMHHRDAGPNGQDWHCHTVDDILDTTCNTSILPTYLADFRLAGSLLFLQVSTYFPLPLRDENLNDEIA